MYAKLITREKGDFENPTILIYEADYIMKNLQDGVPTVEIRTIYGKLEILSVLPGLTSEIFIMNEQGKTIDSFVVDNN